MVDVSEEIKRLKTELSEAQKQSQSRDTSHRSPRSVVPRQTSTRHTDDNDVDDDVCSSLMPTIIFHFLCHMFT